MYLCQRGRGAVALPFARRRGRELSWIERGLGHGHILVHHVRPPSPPAPPEGEESWTAGDQHWKYRVVPQRERGRKKERRKNADATGEGRRREGAEDIERGLQKEWRRERRSE